jgi:hypothetical protein
MTDHRGYTIFCDDIRREVGGKLTLVGIYRSEMVIPADLPIVLPKLGLAILVQALTKAPLNKFKLLIYLPGDTESPSLTAELVARQQSMRSFETTEDKDVAATFTELLLSPVEIKQEGHISARIEIEGKIFPIGSLRVRKRKSDESPPQMTADADV